MSISKCNLFPRATSQAGMLACLFDWTFVFSNDILNKPYIFYKLE